MNCFVGVDVGTTNVKALALPPDLSRVLAHTSAPVETLHPKPGYAEQDPVAVWSAFRTVMADLNRQLTSAGHTVTHVAFSTAMHSLLAMDARGEPMSNAIIWSDNRSEAEAANLRTTHADLGNAIYQQTGTPIHPMIPLCKLAWLRQHDEREYSFVDATSFRVMRDRRLREALAFDDDFSAAGFVQLRE